MTRIVLLLYKISGKELSIFCISHYCSVIFISPSYTSYCLLNSYSDDAGEIMFFLLLPLGSLKSILYRIKPVILPVRCKTLIKAPKEESYTTKC